MHPGRSLVAHSSTASRTECDVFAFAYGQTVAAEEVADLPDLGVAVGRLRQAGSGEIILVGYGAGGLIARQFVENQPASGVTKVIQVCRTERRFELGAAGAAAQSPRRLPGIADQAGAAADAQGPQRSAGPSPPAWEFACIVGTGGINGDGLVSLPSQWSEDLQSQGIPAYPLAANHWLAMRSAGRERNCSRNWSAPRSRTGVRRR